MPSFDPLELPIPQRHQYLIGTVAPRPIAFASTISEEGIPNLAPYSFFNVFSSNPPIAIFSSNRRVRNQTTKDTLHNVEANREVVINLVNHAIVQQMALASVDYPAEVNEFEKAGLTPVASDIVKPFRVKEAPASFECKVEDILPLGDNGGAGNLIICRIVRMHLADEILDENQKVDPYKADLMGRMGRAFYCRANGESVFPLVRSVVEMSMGFDQLPEPIRHSTVLTGNDLAQLAGLTEIPAFDESILADAEVIDAQAGNVQDRSLRLHQYAQQLIATGKLHLAWQVLLSEIQ